MIFVNPDDLLIPADLEKAMSGLTKQLLALSANDRGQFIDRHREATWAHVEVVKALKQLVGHKCWYSEVSLEGADPNVDHFRPKGRVREIDEDLRMTGASCDGYWWLAFDPLNYRLASMHSNQRRTDETTEGGKSDFFPIRGARAAVGTGFRAIVEDYLPLDPCSLTDVELLWFDPDGKPCSSNPRRRNVDPRDQDRVRITVWLYHLDKTEIQTRRAGYVQEVRKDLNKADTDYQLWAPNSSAPNLTAKRSFDQKVAEIKKKIADRAIFARAKQCAVRLAVSDYPWIEEFGVI